MSFVLKTYAVSVEGFNGSHSYLGRSPGQARARAWQAYCCYRDVTFHEFLRISSISRGTDDPGFGRPILVGGKPAHWCGWDGQYVKFVRPGSDVVMNSHPLDVADLPPAEPRP